MSVEGRLTVCLRVPCENGDAAFSGMRCYGVVAIFFHSAVDEQGFPRVF